MGPLCCIWDVTSGTLHKVLQGHTDRLTAAAYYLKPERVRIQPRATHGPGLSDTELCQPPYPNVPRRTLPPALCHVQRELGTESKQKQASLENAPTTVTQQTKGGRGRHRVRLRTRHQTEMVLGSVYEPFGAACPRILHSVCESYLPNSYLSYYDARANRIMQFRSITRHHRTHRCVRCRWNSRATTDH